MARTGTTPEPVDERRARLLTVLKSKGMDLANVSKDLGRNHAYLHQYIFRGKPQYLPEAERIVLAQRTGLSEDEIGRRVLIFGTGRQDTQRAKIVEYGGPALTKGGPVIPIYAAAQGGRGHLIVTFEAVEYLAPPEELLRVRDAYGILVIGDSMIPAYRPGDIAWVHPHKQKEREKDVVLYHVPPLGEAEAIIKTLVSWTDQNWKLRQYNPLKDFTESLTDWPVCHRIVGKRNA